MGCRTDEVISASYLGIISSRITRDRLKSGRVANAAFSHYRFLLPDDRRRRLGGDFHLGPLYYERHLVRAQRVVRP
jgi:hypothetical protein